MNIIESITIRYFRSVYTIKIDQCKDMTVITGKNDVGKSNVLKALNLFFCNNSDYLQPYNFVDDYSITRKEEVKKDTIRGQQFISISIRFLRGNRKANSLPPVFSVTKRWDMHSQESKMSTDVQQRMKAYAQKKNIKYSEKTTSTSLSAFLNNVKYIYIPAIKDDRVFMETLNLLQQSIFDSQNGAILDAPIDKANKAIQVVVDDLQKEFYQSTGITNNIELPNTLNFTNGLLQINTRAGNGSVSIDKRGDGIRSHYIPKILNYVAQKSKYSFIWGFEEPENSYEYRRCIQVANEFEMQYCKECQIFITTHSPAFFGENPDRKSIIRIGNVQGKTTIVDTKIPLAEELGYLELYRSFLQKIQELEETTIENEKRISELRNEISDTRKPLILTEGKTDSILLKVAIRKLGLSDFNNWMIQPIRSGKTSNNETLLRFLIDLSSNNYKDRLVIGMFDRDTKLPNPFSSGADIRDKTFVKLGSNVYAFALPIPHNRKEKDDISIEHYFTDSEIKTEFEGKRLFMGNEFYSTGVFQGGEDYYCKEKNVIGSIKIIEHETKSYVTRIDGTGDFSLSKARFVDCINKEVSGFDQFSFSEFGKIFDVIEQIKENADE